MCRLSLSLPEAIGLFNFGSRFIPLSYLRIQSHHIFPEFYSMLVEEGRNCKTFFFGAKFSNGLQFFLDTIE